MANSQWSLRARIFVSMLFMIIVSFLLTGLISLYHFEEENEEYHQERLKRKEYAIESNIEYFLASHPELQHTDSLASLFSDKICELSDVHNLDIILFRPSGELIIANTTEMFDRGWLPPRVPKAILKRIMEGERRFIMPAADTSDVMLIYSILYNDEGGRLAVLNLPYFEQNKLPDQDLEFLGTLGTLYIVLFIGAAVLAYFLSNYITQSLTVVTQKMRAVQFGKHNEAIEWRSDDEIGELVDEYNRMVNELEKNAIKLAQSERETAWKEMAKQVAHEIKNPLTPMRLSVQMLQRKLDSSDPKLVEFSEGMLTQIDALSNIATAFSRFASMPEMKLEKMDVRATLDRIQSAHHSVAWDEKSDVEPCEITADRDQLTRVLNNLILNAEQAVPEDREAEIYVGYSGDESTVTLWVADNGTGIPDDRREKIFEPSFTTKTHGMGLGLAMVKNIVNGFDGEISFTSVLNRGTTFYVKIPRQITKTTQA